MCRMDEDYGWMVDHYEDRLAEGTERCADCGRHLQLGEAFTMIHGDPTGSDMDDRPNVVVMALDGSYVDEDVDVTETPCVIFDDDRFDWETHRTFAALGFQVCEMKDPRIPIEMVLEPWCSQCRAANKWLVDVCEQHTILVTHEDINEHTSEYGTIELGWAFQKLAVLNRRQWRDRKGQPVPVAEIERLTEKAIEYARTPNGLLSHH